MPLDITIIGGGMIVHHQVLPSIYHLQRLGLIRHITVVATSSANLRALTDDRLQSAFPGQSFTAVPSLDAPPTDRNPERYRPVVAAMPPGNLVFIATPDATHHELTMWALNHNQHVLCVKPLVQTIAHCREIEQESRRRGLLVAVEYHKRFDRRALEARGLYCAGRFGEFRAGQAKLVEPFYYRRSNFQNWFTKDQADPFTYVGCHYVDLLHFITGLRPTAVSVAAVEGRFPNGNTGWMWSSGQVSWENGAILNILNGLGYPDEGPGYNDQGMTLFCEGANGKGATIKHDDQFRGVQHAYIDDSAGAYFRFINPDYFRLVPWSGEGFRPVGYGHDSIEAIVQAANQVNAAGPLTAGPIHSAGQLAANGGLDPGASLAGRQSILRDIDARALIATPANSYFNDLVTEAARLSLAHDGQRIGIFYDPEPKTIV